MAAADLPRLTDRFYRGEHSRTTPGNGLGLSLVERRRRTARRPAHSRSREPGVPHVPIVPAPIGDRLTRESAILLLAALAGCAKSEICSLANGSTIRSRLRSSTAVWIAWSSAAMSVKV